MAQCKYMYIYNVITNIIILQLCTEVILYNTELNTLIWHNETKQAEK